MYVRKDLFIQGEGEVCIYVLYVYIRGIVCMLGSMLGSMDQGVVCRKYVYMYVRKLGSQEVRKYWIYQGIVCVCVCMQGVLGSCMLYVCICQEVRKEGLGYVLEYCIYQGKYVCCMLYGSVCESFCMCVYVCMYVCMYVVVEVIIGLFIGGEQHIVYFIESEVEGYIYIYMEGVEGNMEIYIFY